MATRIVLGITGGIAAYKIPRLIRLLRSKSMAVKVVLTSHAVPFVGSATLRTVSGNPVYQDDSTDYDMGHIRLTQWADLMLVAPATANTIAKMAHGIADNLLCSTLLAYPPEKTIVVPAMNTGMWNNAATKENIAVLKKRGTTVLPVDKGELACGDNGEGRMKSPEFIAAVIETISSTPGPLRGCRLLLSSGPTEEPVDPVRVITNRSSGKMGTALAAEALKMGAEVIMVSGPSATPPPDGVTLVPVHTAAQMETAMQHHFPDCDICIMAAAVSDYRPVNPAKQKLHRTLTDTLTITCTPTNDILAGLGAQKSNQFLIGFALEDSTDGKRALDKMNRKHCDLLVLNTVRGALGTDSTQITLYHPDGTTRTSDPVSKTKAAQIILSRTAELMDMKHE